MNILTLVHINGIVNRYQIVNNLNDISNKTQTQLIWNGQIHCTIIGLNQEPLNYNEQNKWLIKNYRAIYLDNIMIVKSGKVWPRLTFTEKLRSLF